MALRTAQIDLSGHSISRYRSSLTEGQGGPETFAGRNVDWLGLRGTTDLVSVRNNPE
jgi:hypothetical protein